MILNIRLYTYLSDFATEPDNASTSLLGTLLAGIGSLLFFRRKKRNNE
ncbi:TPA: LPXTG cell wall anchor domain-containing protein [Staphylococcus aureus]|nr:LPXTG cell wall anchor domain-containing protein [Staphylococcus aureus]